MLTDLLESSKVFGLCPMGREVNSGLLLAFFTGGFTSTLFVDTGVCSGVSGFRFGLMGCSLLRDFLNLGV